jgi:hypothetical protein
MDPSLFTFLQLLFLTLHNLVRWLVILFAILALVRAFRGWLKGLRWEKSDDRAGILYTSFLDTQFLLGLILYFLFSQWTPQLFANFSAGMQNPVVAFFGLEHVIPMIIAIVAAHMGRALSRKAADAAVKHRTTAVWFSISVVLILVAIPWPFLVYGRPIFRLFGLAL